MPAAILSQYDTIDDDTDNEGADDNETNNEAADNKGLGDGLTKEEAVEWGAGARIDGVAYSVPMEGGAYDDDINKVVAKLNGLYNNLHKGLANDESGNRGAGACTNGATHAGSKDKVEAAQDDATVGRAKVDEAPSGDVDEDGFSGNGGNVLRYGRDGLKAGGNGLHYDMAGLEAAMAVSGSMASCFAELARARQATAEEVATEHKAICHVIVDNQAGALESALGPKAKGWTYLAMLNAEGVFLVMHGLQWWAGPPSGARNQHGKVVGFKGEVRMGTNVPNLWRFEEPEEQLLRLLTLPPVLLSDTARYYADRANNKYYCTTVAPDARGAGWAPSCGRLIPIPVKWVPMFLDYPDSGTAFRRLVDLVNLVDKAKQGKFTYLAWSMAYACLSASKEEHPVSTMSARWKRLVMSRTMRTWATSAWMGQPPSDKTKEERLITSASKPPINDFSSVFGGHARRMAVTVPSGQGRPVSSPPSGRNVGPRPNPSPKARSGTPTVATGLIGQRGKEPLRGGPRPAAGSAPGLTGRAPSPPDRDTSVLAIIRTMMEAQLAANVAMATADNANMIAFHTATAQALAAKNGDKDSKLTVAKKSILQACCGHVDKDTFETLMVYLDMDVEGGTTDALGQILQQRMKTIAGSLHKSNIYMTPQLVATIKSLSFATNGDKTHTRRTKGITPFVTPWRLVEAMNEDMAKEGYFDQATLKSPADIRKHATSAKVELPRTHLGMVQVLNNYTWLLEVLFGDGCDHLVHVRAIRDGLEDNETDLEAKVTQTLCLHLMWKIHHDSRQFFMACKR
jgi:hypothetical protein